MGIWTVTTALQAINRRTHVIAGGVMGSLLGNIATEMSLYEAMQRSLALIPCGSMILGTRPYLPLRLNMGTPLEIKWAYECGVAATRFKRGEADELVKLLYTKYADYVEEPPPGQSLTECYDIQTMTPKPDYLALYYKVKKDLINLGCMTDIPLEK
jgi:methylamine--corrinoid protein Co-methyltransferase